MEQKHYEMPARDGFNVTHFITVADTPDKPTVTLTVPTDPDTIRACYTLWKSRGAEFLTEPIAKYGEIRCYIRDPDGYIIEVGQSTDLKYG
jgi:hypothetical protein